MLPSGAGERVADRAHAAAVCGLTTAEIAAAFLASQPTMTQRLSRARKTLRGTGSAVRIPDPDQLGSRLDEVLAVIYLLFNEGYLASAVRTPPGVTWRRRRWR
jgi:predicted RNA polymerase sigma factor